MTDALDSNLIFILCKFYHTEKKSVIQSMHMLSRVCDILSLTTEFMFQLIWRDMWLHHYFFFFLVFQLFLFIHFFTISLM